MTAEGASTETASARGLVSSLVECFEDVIEMPRLVNRRREILPLAEEFLKRGGPDPPTLSDGARHALASLRYQQRNVAELRDVVDLAVRVCDGSEIRAEHIFGGVGERTTQPGVDITGTVMTRALLRPWASDRLRVHLFQYSGP